MQPEQTTKKIEQRVREKFRRLAVVEFDTTELLPPGLDESNLSNLLRAADIADEIYWQQVSPEMDRSYLLEKAGADDELKEMLLFNYGPYDRLDGDLPLLPVPPRFAGLGFYPKDLTREKISQYLSIHPEVKSRFESPYTVIRRTNSHLKAVAYHDAYKDQVTQLSNALASASEVERNAAFRHYLSQRSKDLLTDEYYESDLLWVQLEDNPLDIVIGPYEVYEDQLMGLKTAYEAAVLCRDFEESQSILHFRREIPELAASLKARLGSSLQIESDRVKLSVADLIYAGGEARSTTPAIAFNLPNDERVIEEVGSRQVILKNVLEAKFEFVAWPILTEVMDDIEADRDVACNTFFHHTLFHEISHSVGPHRITKDGQATTVNRSLKEYYSVLEEAKADTLATCFMLQRHDGSTISSLLETYVAGFLRPVRFGLTNAHGGANAIQFNFLLQEKGIAIQPGTGRIAIDLDRLRNGVSKLAAKIVNIQANGDFNEAKRFVMTYRVISPEIEGLLGKVEDLPIDIRIRYKKPT